MMDIEIENKLIFNCAQTDEGKALIGFIEAEVMTHFGGTAEEIQMQAGKFNLWLTIKQVVEDGGK